MLVLSDVRFREEDFGGIIFRKEDNFFIQVNQKGYELVRSFQNLENIVKAANLYPDFVNSAKKLKVLKEVKERKPEQTIKYDRTSYITKPNPRRLEEGFLRAPLEVGIEITSQCQLKCVHCYGAFGQNIKSELTTEEIFNLIDELDSLGVFAIFIGGGEPTLHPDFFKICEYVLSKDMNVVISTNGVDIDKEMAKEFYKLGNYVGVQVSLEGPNEKINDSMRGKNSFKRALIGLKNLQHAGLNPTIGTTITNLNYKYIEEMINFCISLGVPHIHFMCLMPSGRGDTLYEKLKLSPTQRIWITKKLRGLKNKYKDKIGIDFANFYQQPPSKEFNPEKSYDFVDKIYAGCEAARVKAVVTSTGDVLGCEILREYIGGNIRQNSFLEIWENSKVFETIRSRNAKTIKGKCTHCKYLLACVGDCPSYSIHNGVDFYIGGTECPHQPEKGIYEIID